VEISSNCSAVTPPVCPVGGNTANTGSILAAQHLGVGAILGPPRTVIDCAGFEDTILDPDAEVGARCWYPNDTNLTGMRPWRRTAILHLKRTRRQRRGHMPPSVHNKTLPWVWRGRSVCRIPERV
jgi:hypothetical protein